MTLRPNEIHLGYVKRKSDAPGFWTVRTYLGSVDTVAEGVRGGRSPYRIKKLPGAADDYEDANGDTVLSFRQAQDLALAPPPTAVPSGPIVVGTAFAIYIKYLEDQGRTQTATEAEYRYRRHVLPVLGNTKIADLTAPVLRDWLAKLARKLAKGRTDEDAVRRSRNSANRILSTAKAALNFVYREHEGEIATDSGWRRVRPFHQVDKARVRYLTVEEAKRLINACQGSFRDLVQAALQTGARYSELCRLRVHDFNPDSGTVSISKSKSGRPRHIDTTEEGEKFFGRLCLGRAGNELMLMKAKGEAWGRTDQIKRMAMVVEIAKISPAINFHGLRHTFASLSLMGGVPLQVVSQALGHADTRMAEKFYGHLAPSHKRDAIRAHAPRFGIVQDKKIRPLRG
jgi:integrase